MGRARVAAPKGPGGWFGVLVAAALSFLGIRSCDKRLETTLPEHTEVVRPVGVPTNPPNPPRNDKPIVGVPTSTVKPPLSPPPLSTPTFGPREVSFVFWNVENLFDDHDDGRNNQGDKEYDGWLARNPDLLRLKLDRLAQAILSFNSGRGPDILAVVEVESVRAAQLLQAALNARLADPSLHYRNLVMKEMGSGRHIAPAILTRLQVDASRTRTHGSRMRTLEGRVLVDGKELIVIATHWTSRLQKDGPERRMEYASQIYGACNAIYRANPVADVLIAGDLNDNPFDPSVVSGLRSAGKVPAAPPIDGSLTLFNPMAGWTQQAGFGTIFYQGWHLFDQVLFTPGMLDAKGWSFESGSLRIGSHLANPSDPQRRPWRFGDEKEAGPRGFSDHFPIAVTLRVHP